MHPLPRWIVRPAIPALGWCTARYIEGQRKDGWAASRPIPSAQQRKLRGFFPDSMLAETRIAYRNVPNPWFYPLARRFGLRDLPEMADAGAITFVELIVCPGRLSLQTLFHELVHVSQYRVLGLNQFARMYVRGFLRTGAYMSIPLEIQAYELEDRFRRDTKVAFPVIADVQRRLDDGLL